MKEPCSLIDSDRIILRNAKCIKRLKDPLKPNLMKEFPILGSFCINFGQFWKSNLTRNLALSLRNSYISDKTDVAIFGKLQYRPTNGQADQNLKGPSTKQSFQKKYLSLQP